MNGVRRFLGGGGGGGGTSTTTATTAAPEVPPLNLSSSPNSASPSTSPTKESPLDSASAGGSRPSTGTAGLFIRKDRHRQQPSSSTGTFDDAVAAAFTNGSSSPPPPPLPHGSAFTSTRAMNPPFPVAGPSSSKSRSPVRKSVPPVDRSSGFFGTRDELLMSLLSSEAVVDSRGYEVLSAEEVEELKKEHQVLASRLTACTKKLALETKIRDAAANLAKINSNLKRVSKQSSDQLETSNRKVDAAQRELWRVSERASEVHNRLLQHRAAVLSHSVRDLERKVQAGQGGGGSAVIGGGDGSTSGWSTPVTGTGTSTAPLSPTSSVTSAGGSSKARFDGAHLFAGHENAVVPKRPRPPITLADVAVMEEQLRVTRESLKQAEALHVAAVQELEMIRAEKENTEATLMVADEAKEVAEKGAERAEELEMRLREMEDERQAWEDERMVLEERGRNVEVLERRLEVLEEQSGEAAELEAMVRRAREQGEVAVAKLRAEMEAERARWEEERQGWEQQKEDLQERAKDEIDAAREDLRTLIQSHDIPVYSRELTMATLVSALSKHLDGGGAKRGLDADAQRQMEEQLQAETERRLALAQELQAAKAELASVDARFKEQADTFSNLLAQRAPTSPIEYTGDAAKIVSILQPVWAILPSPEARASRITGAAKPFRTGSPTIGPGSPRVGNASISDMDVRSLKTLYSPQTPTTKARDSQPNGTNGASVVGTFTAEAFAARVQALMSDDRALIERLIRFAQAHDLLKKNAERAQKLAQESNGALETYSKQVKTLEDRNTSLAQRQAGMQQEVQELQAALDRLSEEKRDVEMQAAEQAETCRQLTEANNALSAKTLTLAAEAASTGDGLRKQMDAKSESIRREMEEKLRTLETQLEQAKKALSAAQDELAAMQVAEQTQKIALLEELNSIQEENGKMKAQLRSLGKM